MLARMIVEGTVIVIPCLVAIGAVWRSILAAHGDLAALDVGRLADTLSLGALAATAGFCIARVIGDALRAGRPPLPPNPARAPGRALAYDCVMARLLMVLVGFAGLLVCEPIGDAAGRWFMVVVRALTSSPAITSPLGHAATLVGFVASSLALAALVRVWSATAPGFLGLGARGGRDHHKNDLSTDRRIARWPSSSSMKSQAASTTRAKSRP